MENAGLSAGDIMALTKGNDMFGGVGGFILLFIFLMAISGNGFGFGANNGGFALADIQASLYNQTQDANARSLAQGQCAITDGILNASYNNLLASKDTQAQLSAGFAGISNQIANQTIAMQNMFQEAQIRELSDKLATTRDMLSNANQTAVLTNAINEQTNTILNAQGKYYLNPPCYSSCGCSGLI